jgi:hypothetical protein
MGQCRATDVRTLTTVSLQCVTILGMQFGMTTDPPPEGPKSLMGKEERYE